MTGHRSVELKTLKSSPPTWTNGDVSIPWATHYSVAWPRPPTWKTSTMASLVIHSTWSLSLLLHSPWYHSHFLIHAFLFFFQLFLWMGVVYRQGDRGTNWYFILSGEVVMTTSNGSNKDSLNHVSLDWIMENWLTIILSIVAPRSLIEWSSGWHRLNQLWWRNLFHFGY